MNQSGINSIVDEKSGMAAMLLEDGTCTLVDLLGTEPVGVGDTLDGEHAVPGEGTPIDQRSGRSLTVFIRGHRVCLQATSDEMFR